MKNYLILTAVSITASMFLVSCGSSSSKHHDDLNSSKAIGKIKRAECFSDSIKKLDATCNYITLKTTAEDNRTVDIYYSIIPSKDKDSKKEPIVYLTGGPGGSGTFGMDDMLDPRGKIKNLVDDRDMIIIDYRGTGFSKPFADCKIDNSSSDILETSLKECVANYKKLGIKPTDYQTKYIATDISEILKAQKIDKAILYGTSYGTRVATTVARDYPDVVAGMILDGFFPIEVNGISQASESVLEKLKVLEDSYPNLQVAQLLESLAQKDQASLLGIIKDVDDLFEGGILEEMGMSIEELKDAPKEALYSMIITDIVPKLTYLDGADAVLETFANTQPISYSPTNSLKNSRAIDKKYEPKSDAHLMAYSIILSEEYLFMDEQPAYQFGFSGSVIDALEGYQGGSPMPISDLATINNYFKVPKADAKEVEPLISDIPTLILSGGLDMQTPLYWSKNAKKHLTNSHLFFFAGEDHVLSATNPNAFSLMEKFMNNLSDTSVLDSAKADDLILVK